MMRPPSALGRSGARSRPQTAPTRQELTVTLAHLEREWLRCTSPSELSPPTSPEKRCVLKRCSGIRGCICPNQNAKGRGRVFHNLAVPPALALLPPPRLAPRPPPLVSPKSSPSESRKHTTAGLSPEFVFHGQCSSIVIRTVHNKEDDFIDVKTETLLAAVQSTVLAALRNEDANEDAAMPRGRWQLPAPWPPAAGRRPTRAARGEHTQ